MEAVGNEITFGTATRHFLVANAFQILIISPLSREKTCAVCAYFKFIFIAIAIDEFVLDSIQLVASCIHYSMRKTTKLTAFANCTHLKTKEKLIQFEMIAPAISASFDE